jgi:hypothetical protein
MNAAQVADVHDVAARLEQLALPLPRTRAKNIYYD